MGKGRLLGRSPTFASKSQLIAICPIRCFKCRRINFLQLAACEYSLLIIWGFEEEQDTQKVLSHHLILVNTPPPPIDRQRIDCVFCLCHKRLHCVFPCPIHATDRCLSKSFGLHVCLLWTGRTDGRTGEWSTSQRRRTTL